VILDTITIQQCAPMVDQQLMMRVISIESSHNPYAIGIVNARLRRQPQNLNEAKATAQFLENAGYNYSVGLAQINRSNFSRFKLNFENVFDACTNLNAGGQILRECINRASAQGYQADITHKALSCYYSGQLNSAVGTQYANKVLAKLSINTNPANNKVIQATAITADKSTNSENAVVF
jgi:type IV secretion system protein VirB1